MTDILTSDYSKYEEILQPQMNRYHHPFRSSMSSEKINLEMQQIKYDLYNLYNRLESIRNQAESCMEDIFLGFTSDFKYNTDLTFAEVNGLTDIMNKVNDLNRRLEVLEKGL